MITTNPILGRSPEFKLFPTRLIKSKKKMKAIIVFRMDEEPIGQERKTLGRLKKFNLDNTANLVRNRGAKQISKNVMK